MIKAKVHGLGASTVREIDGPVVVVYDAFDTPLVIVVGISPGLQHIYSVALNEAEFRQAIVKYGLKFEAKVVDVRT